MRGNVTALPDQPESSVAVCGCVAPGASVVPARGEYQPMRRLMSVLLIPAALTRTRTSSGCGSGTGTSHRYSSRSRSPCPVSKIALMQEGNVDIDTHFSETLWVVEYRPIQSHAPGLRHRSTRVAQAVSLYAILPLSAINNN